MATETKPLVEWQPMTPTAERDALRAALKRVLQTNPDRKLMDWQLSPERLAALNAAAALVD